MHLFCEFQMIELIINNTNENKLIIPSFDVTCLMIEVGNPYYLGCPSHDRD